MVSTTVVLMHPEDVVCPEGRALQEIWPDHAGWPKGESVPLLAAVCLGGSGGSWIRDGTYWYCTKGSLTDEGHAIYQALRTLYRKDPILVTVRDT